MAENKPTDDSLCRVEYDDWISLLERRNAKDLLDDPYAIWLEAWSVAEIRLRHEAKPGGGVQPPLGGNDALLDVPAVGGDHPAGTNG